MCVVGVGDFKELAAPAPQLKYERHQVISEYRNVLDPWAAVEVYELLYLALAQPCRRLCNRHDHILLPVRQERRA
jgi:hypothetical protein